METITLINKIILSGAYSILFPWDTPPLTLKVVQRRRAFAPRARPALGQWTPTTTAGLGGVTYGNQTSDEKESVTI